MAERVMIAVFDCVMKTGVGLLANWLMIAVFDCVVTTGVGLLANWLMIAVVDCVVTTGVGLLAHWLMIAVVDCVVTTDNRVLAADGIVNPSGCITFGLISCNDRVLFASSIFLLIWVMSILNSSQNLFYWTGHKIKVIQQLRT